MRYGRKIVLHCLSGYKPELDEMVEQFLRDGVVFVGVVGKDCSRVDDIIDELVVGDGSDETRFILTSFHEGESLDEANMQVKFKLYISKIDMPNATPHYEQ